jgi:Ca2+:H+ antiporter
MIVCNGVVGVCIFIGGLRYREQDVRRQSLSQRAVHDGDHHADPAELHIDQTGTGIFGGVTRIVSVVTILLCRVFLYAQTIRTSKSDTRLASDPNEKDR